ncbi:MAG TPA: pitrilysin family protein [Jatrophihabitans sp.]|nr:pitrilysin family protein [Jatrophihabitans sp.]
MTAIAQLPPLAPFAAPRPFDRHAAVAANGLRIHAIRQAAAPLVTVQLSIPFGVDSPEQTGIAELLAATLCTGTTELDRAAIEDEIALAGGALRCTVDPERLVLSVTVLTGGLPGTLAVIARCLAGARYPEAELDRERTRLIERVKLANATPKLVARQEILRHCFAGHPLTRQVPEMEHVLAADAGAVRRLSERNLVPSGATLLLVGDVEPARTAELAAEIFQPWQAEHPARHLAPLPALVAGRPTGVAECPQLRTAAVRMVAPSVRRDDPRFPALYLANLVLGGYFSSRLNTNLRERAGLVYGVQSLLLQHAGTPLTMIEFDTGAASGQAALDRVVGDLAELAEHGPGGDEVDRARRYATGVTAIYLTTREGIVDRVSGALAAGLEPGWLHEHLARVAEVPHAEVARAARELLAPAGFTNLIVTNTAPSHQGSPREER